jgi:EmrB/QacA subfamily drug resistance transporter
MNRPTAATQVALTVAATFFMVLLDSTILQTSLPRIAASLAVKPMSLTLAVTSYLLAAAAIMPSCGWLTERFGARRVFVTALLTFTLASALCGLAQSLPELILARVLQGLGGGVLMPAGRILTVRHADKGELMRVTALVTWPALLAPILGPALGGYISTYWVWRWNFWINLPIGLIAAAMSMHILPRDQISHPPPFDARGAVLAALGSSLLLGGLEALGRGRTQPGGWWTPALALAASFILIIALIWHLRRSPHPVVRLDPFGIRTYAVSTLRGSLILTHTLHATPFLLPLMFQLGMGYSAVDAGLMLLPYFLGNLLIKPATTPLLRAYGFRQIMLGMGLLSGLAIGACATLQTGGPTAWLSVLLFAAGAFRSIHMTAANTLMFADVPGPWRASASTLSAVLSQLSNALGVVVASLFLAASQQLSGHGLPLLTDFHNAFLALGLVASLSLFAFQKLHPDDGAEVSGHRPRSDSQRHPPPSP